MSVIFPHIVSERRPVPQYPVLPEEHVIAIWLSELHPERIFHTRGGAQVRVLDAGRRNRHDGPDFLDATVVIDGVLQRGAIEVHVRERDWERHRHHENPRYGDVVLHVALYAEARFSAAPQTVILATQLAVPLRGSWAAVRRTIPSLRASGRLPCITSQHRADPLLTDAMLVLASAERFARKQERLGRRLDVLAGKMTTPEAWRQTVYEAVARALGYGGNEDSFERLAQQVPLAALHGAGYRARLSLLTNAAGLDGGMDAPGATADGWNVSGILPGNRPLSRLRWFADWAPRLDDPEWWRRCFDVILSGEQDVDAYVPLFGGRVRTGQPGPERTFELVVNVLAPCVRLHAAERGLPALGRAAATLYFTLAPAPQNRHTRRIAQALEHFCSSATEQQGMIELATGYCARNRCRSCLLGGASRAATWIPEPEDLFFS
ncbi:MAG: DUF2851 family protein [Bacteroidetes bacterium]|nr:DUF2851 family protein [Bacteroidota bacterium]